MKIYSGDALKIRDWLTSRFVVPWINLSLLYASPLAGN